MPNKTIPLDPKDNIIRTLNFLIDQAAATIQWNQTLLKEAMDNYSKCGPYVVNKTTHEDRNRKWYDHDTRTLERIRDISQEILSFEMEIGRLTRMKLRLFDDCDFRGGEEILSKILSSDT